MPLAKRHTVCPRSGGDYIQSGVRYALLATNNPVTIMIVLDPSPRCLWVAMPAINQEN